MNRYLVPVVIVSAGAFLTTIAQAQGALDGVWQMQETAISGGTMRVHTPTTQALSFSHKDITVRFRPLVNDRMFRTVQGRFRTTSKGLQRFWHSARMRARMKPPAPN